MATKMVIFEKLKIVASVIAISGTACLLVVFGQIAWWATDRNPPFIVTDYGIASARQGETTTMHAKVKRDVGRGCGASYSRAFFDSTGARSELTEGPQLMNAQAIAELDKRMPDAIAISVTVPPTAAKGMGTVVTVLDYSCNPVHLFYPIPVVLTMDFLVL